jgi:hypothetical protein
MNTFTIIVRNGPYSGNKIPGNWISEAPIQTFDQVVSDILEGQVDADDIAKVLTIDIAAGTTTDVTGDIADLVFHDFDANNRYAWKKMREWLEGFGHDCRDLLGETRDISNFYDV